MAFGRASFRGWAILLISNLDTPQWVQGEMNRPAYLGIVSFIVRVSLGLVFLVAAAVKLLDLNDFAESVADFGLVYDGLVKPSAWAVVFAELLVGSALVFRLRGSVAAAFSLLLVFISVLTYGLVLGLDVDCGCFGPAFRVGIRTQLITDFVLLLFCAIIYWSDNNRRNFANSIDA